MRGTRYGVRGARYRVLTTRLVPLDLSPYHPVPCHPIDLSPIHTSHIGYPTSQFIHNPPFRGCPGIGECPIMGVGEGSRWQGFPFQWVSETRSQKGELPSDH